MITPILREWQFFDREGGVVNMVGGDKIISTPLGRGWGVGSFNRCDTQGRASMPGCFGVPRNYSLTLVVNSFLVIRPVVSRSEVHTPIYGIPYIT